MKEKEENERRWKTKSGFDNVMKRLNWNEHPKRPAQSTIDNLKIPHHHQAAETKQRLKGFQYVPGQNGKADFQSKIKSQGPTFSDADYFKTVFISGDDMVKEIAEQKQKEIDDFNKKVVVANQHFYVNTLEKSNVSQLDRFTNVREDDVKKVGLRHSKRRISAMVERQILVAKTVDPMPVSMLKDEEYFYKDHRPPWKVFDKTRSIAGKDMDTNIHPQYREKTATSRKVFIQPVTDAEKAGPKWAGAGGGQ